MMKIILALAVSAMAQQVYKNDNLNTKYTTPAGWAFEEPDTTSYGEVRIRPTRPGLNPIFLQLAITKTASAGEGFYYPQAACFLAMKFFYTFYTSAQAPILTAVQDTIISGVHLSSIILKQLDQGKMIIVRSASNRVYNQTIELVTSITDYQTNSSLYEANWANTEFLSLTAPTKVASTLGRPQGEIRKELADLLGRRMQAASHRITLPSR